MTDRRRYFFILLLVLGLLVASLAVIATKPTRLGLDLEGGVELVYEAQPTREADVSQDNLNRAIDVMRDRVDRLGVAEPELQRSGNSQISVALPGVTDLERAIETVGTTAQLFFYDWEPNVIGPDGKPAPDDPQVTGQLTGAGQPTAGIPLYDAVIRAAKRPATNPDTATTESRFYLVDDENEQVERPQGDPNAEFAYPSEEELLEAFGLDEVPEGQRIVEVQPGTIIVRADTPDEVETQPDKWYVLNDNPALSGTDIKDPELNYNNAPGGDGSPVVTFGFTDRGRDIWQETTREIAQRGQANQIPGQEVLASAQHFAIVLDDELISVPYINYAENPDGIDGANGSQIEGGFTIQTAQALVDLLRTGALPLKLELISQSQVSATLGQQALDEGLVAGIVGFCVVALFLLIFYRVLGVIAVAALAIYGIYFFALIKLIPITLTLPGIAGLILTLSVAADANIVIFERVKEEIRAGRSIHAGIAQGYKKGLSAIIDANVVTFMVAFILFMVATAGVRGFALTLGVGTLVSLFTAVLATQAALGTMGESKLLQSKSALGASEGKSGRIRLDFMGLSRWFFAFSGVILLVCALAIGSQGLNFGIDFESGTRITTALEQPADVDEVREAVDDAGFAGVEVQQVSNEELGDNAFQLSGDIQPDQVPEVQQLLDTEFGGTPEFQNQSIGPTFGETVAQSAIIAIIASLVVISVYIALRFEWKYAVPVLIALSHDLLITAGVYALTDREVTTSTVAALLTILGFSLYDTIIVFDRIRENVPRMPRAAFSQIVNRSMSEVIVRSLATSFCTLLPVLALMLFGGETLKDFAFALLVGTASGTYSSIFIAGPVLTHWKEREPIYRVRAQRIVDQFGRIPAYADEMGGVTDVEPEERKRRSRRGSLLSADTPDQVSREEFDEMVRDIEPEVRSTRSSGAAVTEPKPAAKPKAAAEPKPSAPEPPAPAPADSSADLTPEDLVMKDNSKRKPPSRNRNKRRKGR